MTNIHQLLQITDLYVFTRAHVIHHVQHQQLLMLLFSETGVQKEYIIILQQTIRETEEKCKTITDKTSEST